MKVVKFSLFIIFIFVIAGFKSSSIAQSKPVLYFCENYTADGEVGISDIFTTGFLTIMIKCDYPLGLTDCNIEYDKLNLSTNQFSLYKKFDFVVKPELSYIFFSRTDNSDLSFDEPGIYRVLLRDNYNERIASSLIQIVNK
jgi:hypothetical protein